MCYFPERTRDFSVLFIFMLCFLLHLKFISSTVLVIFMKTKKLESVEDLITDFLSKDVSVLRNTTVLSSYNPQIVQDYLKNYTVEKANNSYVDLKVISLNNSKYQDGDIINFLDLKNKILNDSKKKYLVLKNFENDFYVSDKKILSISNSLSGQDNYLFVGLFKK
jgi:nucleoid-associated protein YejK